MTKDEETQPARPPAHCRTCGSTKLIADFVGENVVRITCSKCGELVTEVVKDWKVIR